MKKMYYVKMQGFSMSYLFLTLAVLFTMSLLIVTAFSDKIEFLDSNSIDKRAQLAAEYGVSKAIAEIRKNPRWTGITRVAGIDRQIFENRKMPYSDDKYSIWVCNNFYGEKEKTGLGGIKVPPGRCYIMGMGKASDNKVNEVNEVSEVEKFAAALIEKSTPFADFALFAENKIDISGNVAIQSGNPTEKRENTVGANLGTNENRNNSIFFNNACGFIDGSIFAGPGVNNNFIQWMGNSENIRINGKTKKLLWNRPLPPVETPRDIPDKILRKNAISDGFSIEPGNYVEKLTVEKNETILLTGPGEYVFRGINIDEGGRIVTDTTQGPVKIFLEGNLSIRGNNENSGIFNINDKGEPKPSRLLIYGTDKCKSIEISGNDEYYMGIYARNAKINMSGNGKFHGSFVGKEITLSDAPSIIFDPLTGIPDEGMMTIKLISWQRF